MINIVFQKSGRGKAQCQPNPDYPDGVQVDASEEGKPSCSVELPYPAPECGWWVISCDMCQIGIVVTAAGRPDDPRGVKLKCRAEADPGETLQ